MDVPSTSSTSTTTTTQDHQNNARDVYVTDNNNNNKKEHSTNTVPFIKLFGFADTRDKFFMLVGTIAAIGNGLCLPLMTLLFGELTDSFGQNQNIREDVVRQVSKVPYYK